MTPEPKTIVCIQESPEDIELIHRMIDCWGNVNVRIRPAIDSDEGIRMVQEEKPDLVLLDFHLPKSAAIDVFDQLKTDPSTTSIPIILLMDSSYIGDSSQIFTRGPKPDAILAKPIDLDEILQTIRQLLKLPPQPE